MKRTTLLIVLLSVLLLDCMGIALAQRSAGEPTNSVEKWRDLRFGMFIHWGPVSLKGTEIGWSRGGLRRGREGRGTIPVDVYDNLYKQFNPVKFNADEWVQIAKDAGMKYLVFTTKHHDGFVNFDSKLTDYKITSPESPFRRDIVAELAEACNKGGIGLGFYYSQPDWHHPDYRTDRHSHYIEYLHGQIRELCTNYGKIDIIWFDGLGGKAKDWDAEKLIKMIRQLQPHAIINNRCGVPCDFSTPEQKVGSFNTMRPWETCMTICKQWAWKPNDRLKSFEECINILVNTVGGDGNLLLNVGPMPDGRIEPRQVERLHEIGNWLKENGNAIYGTRGGPFKPGDWGASTHKGNLIYVHVLKWPEDKLILPAISQKVVKSRLLNGENVSFTQSRNGVEIMTPPRSRQDPIDTIVVLELNEPVRKK